MKKTELWLDLPLIIKEINPALVIVGTLADAFGGNEIDRRQARGGFLFRGLLRGPRDALPGILLISLIWSLLHIQYDWFGASLVFGVGVLLGYVRLYSGSTTLVILLHALLNLESVLETVVVLGWV